MRYWKCLLFLLAALVLTPAALAYDAPEDGVRAVVLFREDADPARTAASLAAVDGVEVLWRYERLFPGAAVEADASALERLEALEGVESVGLARSYALPQSKDADPAVSDGGLELMNAASMLAEGHNGDGVVIAVLDSGLRTGHEVFADYGLAKNPALSRSDVEAFAANGGTAGRYINARIPFAYDYYNKDDNVSTSDSHGSHVTALAAGYAPGEGSEPLFCGTAPAAQILSMKVFPDGTTGGADDAVILRALEDAWNLGADVVNLSLGTGGGFTRDDVLGGLYCQAFSQMRESGVIICCAAGNSGTASTSKNWGQPLPTAGYADYGSVCSPGSYLGSYSIAAAGYAGDQEETAEASDYSSWGTTPDLRLVPALTAFGGPATSAGSKADDSYVSETGTSMASGSAAGAFAVAIQTARELGAKDKVSAAALAESLLLSTARILEDGGVPASPRKQGAGLVDLSAAVSAGLVVSDPLLEVGDNAEGRFTLEVTLHNLTASAVTADVRVTALTDAYTRRGGIYYRTLSPLDITEQVAVSGGGAVSVPARGERTVKLTLTAGQDLRRQLEEVYPYGFFLEGYVTAAISGGREAHATFLGFCGDWEDAPILEPTDHRAVQDTMFRLGAESGGGRLKENAYLDALPIDAGANRPTITVEDSDDEENIRYLAENPRAYALHDDRFGTLPSGDTGAMFRAGDMLAIDLYTLRNAAHVIMLVSDPGTGAVHYVDDNAWLPKSEQSSRASGIAPSARYQWDGTGANGELLPAGTQVRVDFYAWLDRNEEMEGAHARYVHGRTKPEAYAWLLEAPYEQYREWSFPVTLDGAAPTASVAAAGTGVTVTLRDELYLAYGSVRDDQGRVLAEDAFFPEQAGQSFQLTVDLAAGGTTPETLYITAEDYASNTMSWSIDTAALTAGSAAAPARCPAALLTDVELGSWYHDAVDFVLDRELMACESTLTFQPGENATRAQVVTALYNLAGRPASKLTSRDLPFRDVSSRAKYMAALCWAYENKLVEGHGDKETFAGGADVTREQLAVMLHRYASLSGGAGASGNLSAFPDGGSVASWARDAMTWATGQGLISGAAGGRLAPKSNTTRAELAQILMRFAQK